MGKEISYISLAENDYQYLKQDIQAGRVSNLLAYNSQNICERYLKGVIVALGLESNCTNKEMSSHSLRKLCNFLKQNAPQLNKQINYPVIIAGDGYYFNTRYPGDDYLEVTKSDIQDCWKAVEEARRIALTIEQKKTMINLQTAQNTLDSLMDDKEEIGE